MRKKQTKITKLKKQLKNFMNTFNIHETMIRDINGKEKHIETLDEQIEFATKKLNKIEKLVEHNKEIYHELEELKELNGSSNTDLKSKELEILRKHLKHLSLLAEKHQEHIKQTVFSSDILQLQKPKLIKTFHPLKLIKNYKKYNGELEEYNETVRNAQKAEVNITLAKETKGIKIASNGTRHYKMENLLINGSYVKTDDKYISIYYLADIPAFLSPYVLFKLMTSSLTFTISVFIEPTNSSELIKKARQRLSTLEMQQQDSVKKGKLRDQQKDKSIEEIAAFIEELVHEVEKGLLYSFYLSLEAKNEEELKAHHKEIKNISDALELSLTKYIFAQKNAYETMLPFHNDTLKQNRILQSSAVSYLMPFITKQIHDPEGIFLGFNAYHESLVFVNPFTVRNSNVNILGVSGAGKSVTAKAMATRLFMRGTQIIIIDPEGEYVDYAQKIGGSVIEFSRKNGINPFSIKTTDRAEILDHISVLKTFFKFFIRTERYDGAILDKVLVDLYNDYPTNKPTFTKFLKKMKKTEMYEDLNVLNDGSLQGVFNSERELDLDNDLIVFNLLPLGDDEKKPPAMYLLTSLIWTLVNKKSDRRRMLFIDEAHKLLIDREVATFYRSIVKQARKRNLGVVSITQDVEDFLHSEFGKAVLTNSETKILLKQSYATLSLMENIFPMTNEEKQQLGNLAVGEIVLFRENEHMRADIFVLENEEELVGIKRVN
jgi:conjugal transfer ATP-binding protein TraC